MSTDPGYAALTVMVLGALLGTVPFTEVFAAVLAAALGVYMSATGPSRDAAPLFLAAWTWYRDGNGALAGIAADLALKSDPSYSAADLLLTALGRVIDPRTLPKLRATTSEKGGDEPANA